MLYNLNKSRVLAALTATVLGWLFFAPVHVLAMADSDNSLKDSPLVSLYKNDDKPEKGPIRIRFTIDDSMATKEDWDENFEKRHLILREVKKGFTGYMYKFENDLMSSSSQCDERNALSYVNIILKVSEITTGPKKDNNTKIFRLKLDSVIEHSLSKFLPASNEFNYIRFGKPKKGKQKLSHSAVKKLRRHGDELAKTFVKAKLGELVAFLYQGSPGSDAQTLKRIEVCEQILGDNLIESNDAQGS